MVGKRVGAVDFFVVSISLIQRAYAAYMVFCLDPKKQIHGYQKQANVVSICFNFFEWEISLLNET